MLGSITLIASLGGSPPPRAELARLMPAAQTAELELVRVEELAEGDRVVHFEQRHHGYPVIGRGASVRVDANGRARAAHGLVQPTLPSAASLATLVDRDRAANAAARVLGETNAVPRGSGSLVVAVLGDEAIWAWRFLPRFAGLPFAPEILIDAVTGEVRVARNRAVTLAPTASVYRSNPVRTPGVVPLPLLMPPTEPHLANETIVAKTCVDRKRVVPFGGAPNGVHVCDLDSVASPDAEGNYAPTPDDQSPARSEDPFAEVSIFYHATRVHSFFQSLAMPGTSTTLLAKTPFTAVANFRIADGLQNSSDLARAGLPDVPLAPFSNAFFAPPGDPFGVPFGVDSGGLWFGQGAARDYAYDGDVVYHEFTHAMVDATIGLAAYAFDEQGLSAAPGALNEGIADLFSAALTGDPDLGEYTAPDQTPGLPWVRTLANADACPTQLLGEVHFDSTAFSGAVWAARVSLPDYERIVFDRALFETLRTHPHVATPTFASFIQLMLETFRERSSLAVRAIEQELTQRGFLPECRREVEATNRTVIAPADAAGRIGYIAPGKLDVGVSPVPGTMSFRIGMGARAPGSHALAIDIKARAIKAPFFAARESSPFKPIALVKWDAPITHHGKDNDADAKTDLEAHGTNAVGKVPIPEGARVAYVQIANAGDGSGVYDELELTVEKIEDRTASAPASDESAAPVAASSSCGVSMRSPPTHSSSGLASTLAALVITLRRRRCR